MVDDVRSCIKDRHDDPPVEDECVSAFLVLHLNKLFRLQELKEIILESEYRERIARWCDVFTTGVDGPVKHTLEELQPHAPHLTYTEVCAMHLASLRKPWVPPSSSLLASRAAVEDDYPCGDGDGRKVLCASTSPFPDGDHFVLAMVMAGEIPLADAEHFHQFGFVFDSDGDPDNNYVPASEYPNDFFQATDRWYVANYSPTAGWSIQVSNANGSAITSASSDARIVIDGQTMLLVFPADELATTCPAYRMTAFSHLGDYGFDPPHEWSGDVEPAVDVPLETRCIEFPPLPE